ncbi:MAG: hypothetical protein ACREBI_03015 [Nitrosotalea sp.]
MTFKKSLAVLPAAILFVALAVQMPNFASAQGTCVITGTGTAIGPDTETFTSTNSTSGAVITYTVESECLDKGAGVGDNMTGTFNISATCNDNGTGTCATLSDFGTIGTYEAAQKLCNHDGTCSVSAVTPAAQGTAIPTDGTEVQILSGSASDLSLRAHGNIVAHLGEVSMTAPAGFSDVGSPDFSLAFQAPRP